MGTVGKSLISVNNVWLGNGLKHNLLSISQFCGSGYEVFFNNVWMLQAKVIYIRETYSPQLERKPRRKVIYF